MIEAHLADELKLILYDTEKGKEIKSFPKRGADPAKREAAETGYKEMKRKVNGIVKKRVTLLKQQFITGKHIEAKIWSEAYLNNPVLTRIAQLLVWTQDGQTFTVHKGRTILDDGTTCDLSGEPICLAHPLEMDTTLVSAWQSYYLKHRLKQPFAQIWEPVTVRNTKSIHPNRYKGSEITVGHILGLENQGLVHYRYSMDGPTEFEFAGSMHLSGVLEQRGHWLTEFGADNRIVLGTITQLHVSEPRKLNRVISYLDSKTVLSHLKRDDDVWLGMILPGKTPEQIIEFLNMAIENQANRCTALLLDYKHKYFSSFESMDEFTLDL